MGHFCCIGNGEIFGFQLRIRFEISNLQNSFSFLLALVCAKRSSTLSLLSVDSAVFRAVGTHLKLLPEGWI